MDKITSDIKTFMNNADFKSFWQSLDIKNSIKKPTQKTFGIWLEVFREIQELGISVTDKSNRQRVSKLINERFDGEKKNMDDLREMLIEEMSLDEIVIYIHKDYFKAITISEQSSEDTGIFGLMRDGLYYELGLRYPKFKIVFTDELKEGFFKFKINDLTTDAFIGLQSDQCLVNDTVDRLILLQIKGTATINPANGSACSIISLKDIDRAKQAGLTTWDSLGYLVLCFSKILRSYGKCFVTNNIVNQELDKLATNSPKLIEVLRNRHSLGVITKILRHLIFEELSIRNLSLIIMSILDVDYVTTQPQKYIVLDNRLPLPNAMDVATKPEIIAEYVRSTMKEYISHKYTRGRTTMPVYLLAPAIEEIMDTSISENIMLSEVDSAKIIKAINAEIGGLPSTTQNPIILTVNSIRLTFKKLITEHFPRLTVLAYNELSPATNIQPIARIEME